MKKNLLPFGLLMALLLLASCASRKDFVYVNDLMTNTDYPVTVRHEAVIQCDDRLDITVSSKNPELAMPFNVQSGNIQIDATGNVTSKGQASVREKGYRVDNEGNIDFPLLGKIHLQGKTLNQAIDEIKGRIEAGNYIKDPLVSIDFLNFRYTVLGAVGSTGTYNVNGDRITLLEAIAKAGDLTDKANLERVCVIREDGNNRRIYTHDIRQKSVFDSPAFYLKQNDIVYVEPKYRKKDSEDRTFQYTTLSLSLASLVTSILWLVIKE